MHIGVTDSGIGGLNLLRRLVREYPHNRYTYFADNRYSPYGNRNVEFLAKRMREVCDDLLCRGADIIALGCNTAGSNVAEFLRVSTGVAIAAVIPEAYPERERTLIMCTPLTARSEVVADYVRRGASVYADPKLVPLIERYPFEPCRVAEYVLTEIEKYRPESITLGCTHYIYLKEAIELELGVRCIDGTDRAVKEVGEALKAGGEEEFRVEIIFSGRDESEKYIKLAGF